MCVISPHLENIRSTLALRSPAPTSIPPGPRTTPLPHGRWQVAEEKAGEICLKWRSKARGKCEEAGAAHEAWQAEALKVYACEQEMRRARQQVVQLLATIGDEEAAKRATAAVEMQLEATRLAEAAEANLEIEIARYAAEAEAEAEAEVEAEAETEAEVDVETEVEAAGAAEPDTPRGSTAAAVEGAPPSAVEAAPTVEAEGALVAPVIKGAPAAAVQSEVPPALQAFVESRDESGAARRVAAAAAAAASAEHKVAAATLASASAGVEELACGQELWRRSEATELMQVLWAIYAADTLRANTNTAVYAYVAGCPLHIHTSACCIYTPGVVDQPAHPARAGAAVQHACRGGAQGGYAAAA